ncbi:MAG: hypothetical protein JSU70_05845, partial [Phycisphaerales bacterium]
GTQISGARPRLTRRFVITWPLRNTKAGAAPVCRTDWQPVSPGPKADDRPLGICFVDSLRIVPYHPSSDT